MIGDPIQHFIRQADEQGRVTFSTKPRSYIKRKDYKTHQAFIREHVIRYLYDIKGLVFRLGSVASAFPEVDARWERGADGDEVIISFNLARALMLPGEDAAAELGVYREFFMSMRPFFEKYAEQQPRLQITNNRTSTGKLYGAVKALYNNPVAQGAALAVEFQAVLDAQLEASSALQAWLRAYALELNRMGPWSWFIVTADHVFGYEDHPILAICHRGREAERTHREANPDAPLTASERLIQQMLAPIVDLSQSD